MRDEMMILGLSKESVVSVTPASAIWLDSEIDGNRRAEKSHELKVSDSHALRQPTDRDYFASLWWVGEVCSGGNGFKVSKKLNANFGSQDGLPFDFFSVANALRRTFISEVPTLGKCLVFERSFDVN